MAGKILGFIKKYIVSEVPDEYSACYDCGLVECSSEKWINCPNRLARAAGLKALDAPCSGKSAETRATKAGPPLAD